MTAAAAGVELATPAWLAAVRDAVEAEAADPRWEGLQFSFAERLVAVPAALSGAGDEVGFTCTLQEGEVHFVATPSDEVEFAQRVEYDAARELAGQVYDDGAVGGASLKERFAAEGRIVTTGARSEAAAAFWLAVHNRLAPLTVVPHTTTTTNTPASAWEV
ncbi:MAG TPA: hypothetical protein VHA79_09925 [Mycobacteriales bacterium]|nr:hypothetical protein [Mycobacteriales bacterium]